MCVCVCTCVRSCDRISVIQTNMSNLGSGKLCICFVWSNILWHIYVLQPEPNHVAIAAC